MTSNIIFDIRQWIDININSFPYIYLCHKTSGNCIYFNVTTFCIHKHFKVYLLISHFTSILKYILWKKCNLGMQILKVYIRNYGFLCFYNEWNLQKFYLLMNLNKLYEEVSAIYNLPAWNYIDNQIPTRTAIINVESIHTHLLSNHLK